MQINISFEIGCLWYGEARCEWKELEKEHHSRESFSVLDCSIAHESEPDPLFLLLLPYGTTRAPP